MSSTVATEAGSIPSISAKRPKADPEPVTHISPEFKARIAQIVFGVWKNGDDTWLIRPPDGRMPSREALAAPLCHPPRMDRHNGRE